MKGRLNVLKYFVDERKINVNKPCPSSRFSKTWLWEIHPPPTFVALKYRHLAIFHYLTEEKRANLRMRDKRGENILFEAVRSDYLQVMKYVLEERNVKLNLNTRNWRNETLVHQAALHNNTNILEYLVVQKHVNVNFVNGCYTPLHYAAWKNNVEPS
jgi:hypothetical protein